MTAEEILAELKKLAPSVVFIVKSYPAEDPLGWDGDGPHPEAQGLVEHESEVTAKAITNGEFVEGSAYLCGSWYTPGEPDPDISGYLPQMLEEAAMELRALFTFGEARDQLASVQLFLREEMRKRYDTQRSELEKERASASA